MLKILVAVDGSELSLDGVRHTLQWLKHGLQASVVLAHVQEPATLYELVTTRDPDLIAAASLEAGEHLLAPARALLDAAGVAYETDIAVGDAAHTLVDLAENHGADMLVIGAKGHGALSGALLGSVSQEVSRLCPVPVTIVKHPEVAPSDEAMGDETE